MDLEQLHKTAQEVVSREDVKYLIGWKKGSFGYRTAPVFVTEEADAKELTFSPLCTSNLATYLTLTEKVPLPRGQEEDKRKVAIMVKGCDSRAVTQLIVEKGIGREQVVVIGCPCAGVVDVKKLAEKYPETAQPADLDWDGFNFTLTVNGETVKIDRDEIVAEKCRLCRYPNPVISDFLISEEVEPLALEADSAVEALEEKSIEERWDYWMSEFSRCVRCYSCRNACPLCYCEDCILDRLNPSWVNRAVNFSENTAFNLARAFHLAGRCVECGECERVCPAELPLGQLNRKLASVVRDKYDFEPGLDPDGASFQASFKPDDPGDFIL